MGPEIQQKKSHIELIDQDLLQKYIIYARQRVKPQVSDMDKDKLANFYKDIRAEAFRSGGAPMTARHIESIIRLAEASAKIELLKSCGGNSEGTPLSPFLLLISSWHCWRGSSARKLQTGLRRENNSMLLRSLFL